MKPLITQQKARRNYRCGNCDLKIWRKAVYLRLSVKRKLPDGKRSWVNKKLCESCSKSKGLWPGANGE